MRARRFLIHTIAWLAWLGVAHGFNGHAVTEGPLTLTIAAIPTVQAFNAPQPCAVSVANTSSTEMRVTLEMFGLIDDCRPSGATERIVTVPARGKVTEMFAFVCGLKTHSALYPVHLRATFPWDGGRRTAHAVQIFETDFGGARTQIARAEPDVVRVPASGAFALAGTAEQRIAWSYTAGETVRLPVGWTGTDPTSAASFHRGPVTRGGEPRAALQLHPPYRPKAGTVSAEYRLQLPAIGPIRMEFFNAIRDSTPREGASDGVTFRVWVNDEKVFERHTDAKSWEPGSADLTPWAGQTVTLRLESHPGPRHNTTCDASFWGDPVITVGAPPRRMTASDQAALVARARAALSRASGGEAAGLLRYGLEGVLRAVIALGPNGLADGVIAFGEGGRHVTFAGLHIAVQEHVLGAWPSAAVVRSVAARSGPNGRTEIVHRVTVNEQETDVVATVWSEGPALRIKVECPDHITALGLGAADQQAPRVYYGHGYCIVEPAAFVARADGHNLSTRHVGFDFAGGMSLLTASDTPVDHLRVDPERQIYRLQTHPNATLTFVPGVRGAFDCAIRFRPLFDGKAAPGVAAKAGRFVFDLWGGRYAENAAALARCFDYGLTHSLAIVHTWQRWGYDYRLPDIFPPLPNLGTLEELRRLGDICRQRGVRWGLHDNYIDIYPDATGFTYDVVTFTPDGKPRRAWLNEGRDAQSYQFRPDKFAPFLKRNLDLIGPALRPTASFVDVFASLTSFDYHDANGTYHSKLETQRAWGEAFAAIREAGGNHAPTISEAGADHLIGWLDGSDAQFMQLGPKPERFHNVVTCRDWERVPWFDAVNHTRLSLHGVGYSDRYQGGRSREEHGIESDDYLSAEVLTGHALMIDRLALGRGAVRKYWLAQEFIASVAPDEIRAVELAGGDIHRAIVTWNSGARVYVNRGDADWMIAGHRLPQFGFHAANGAITCSVERIGGAIIERSRGPGGFYVNSRVFANAAPLTITPRAGKVSSPRWLANASAVDFGAARTAGAFRCQVAADGAVITPLPDGEEFEVRLRLNEVFGRAVRAVSVQAIDPTGAFVAEVRFAEEAGELVFTAARPAFAYRLAVR